MADTFAKTRVLVIDDHRAVQLGLRELLAAEFPGIHIEFADGESSAMEQLAKGHWSMAISDIDLPGMSGLDLIPKLKSRRPQLRVLVYTMHAESQFGVRAFRCGADGFLSKDSTPETLFAAVRQILRGRRYVSSELAEELANSAAEPFGDEALSSRDYQIVQGLAAGKTLTELAAELNLNIKTVSAHRSRIYETLRLKTQADLIRYALEHGLLQE